MALTVKQIQENINMLMKKAGDRQTSEAEKKASMYAEAAAQKQAEQNKAKEQNEKKMGM